MMALRDMTCLRSLSVGESWLRGCFGLAAVMRHLSALETLGLWDVGGTNSVYDAVADPEVCPVLARVTESGFEHPSDYTTMSGGRSGEKLLRDGRLRLVYFVY